MPIQLNEENGGNIPVVGFSGKLGKADYEHFVPEFERLLRQHGKLRVLIDMTRDGWGKGRATRHAVVRQAVHRNDCPILRSRRRRCGAEMVGGIGM